MAKLGRLYLRLIDNILAVARTHTKASAGALPDSYLRYLTNSLRAPFDLPGVPLRLHLRTGKNPYV